MATNLQCDDCGADNRPGARFCLRCGAALTGELLALSCPACGEARDSAARFCSECGCQFDAGSPAEASRQAAPAGSARRGPRWGCVLAAALVLLLLIAPPSGIAYYFLYYKNGEASNGMATPVSSIDGHPDVLRVEPGLDPMDSLLLAVELAVDEENRIREARLYSESPGDAESIAYATYQLADHDEPLTVSLDDSGRPVHVVLPGGEHLAFEYPGDEIRVHFLLPDGTFGVVPVALDGDVRQLLDDLQTSSGGRVRFFPPEVELLSAQISDHEFSMNSTGPGADDFRFQTADESEITLRGHAYFDIHVQDERGRAIPGASATISGCEDCETEYAEFRPGWYKGQARYEIPISAPEYPPVAAEDRDALERERQAYFRDCMRKGDAVQSFWNRSWWLLGIVTAAAASLASAGAGVSVLTTAVVGAPSLVTIWDPDECFDHSAEAARLAWVAKGAVRAYNEVAAQARDVEICVDHPMYLFESPCRTVAHDPFADAIVDRVFELTIIGERRPIDPRELEFCPGSDPIGFASVVLLSHEPFLAQAAGAFASIFAPPDYESKCDQQAAGSDEDWIDRAVDEFTRRLTDGGFQPDHAGAAAGDLLACLEREAAAGVDEFDALQTCRIVAAIGEFAGPDPSITFESVFHFADVRNALVFWYFAGGGAARGFVRLTIEAPATEFDQLAVGESEYEPAELSGCVIEFNFVSGEIQGDYDPLTGSIEGEVVASDPVVRIHGFCAVYQQIEAEGRADGLLDDDGHVGSRWRAQPDAQQVDFSIHARWPGEADSTIELSAQLAVIP